MKYLGLCLIVISGVLFSFLLPFKFLLNFSNDDSFFYIKTAINFASGLGSTFDLVQPTNGYHPLWFLILSFFFFLLKLFIAFSPEVYFRFVVMLDFFICSATLIVLRYVWEINYGKLMSKYFYLFTPLFLLFVFTRDLGLETHVICLLLALFLLVKSYELKKEKPLQVSKSILLLLLFLSRIDFLFTLIPLMITADYMTMTKELRKKSLMYSVAAVVIVSAIYYTSNCIFFGHLINISGTVKNSFPEIILLKNIRELTYTAYITNQFAKTLFAILIIAVFFSMCSIKKFRKQFTQFDFLLQGVCIGTLIFIVLNLTFNIHSLKEWYVAIPAFACSLMLVRIVMIFPRLYYPVLVIFITAFVYHFNLTRLNNPKWDNTYDYALELKKNTLPDDRIFQIDLCGIVGYFSERNVVNGDGLINGFEYQEYLKSNNLEKYFRDKKINYYSTHSTEKGIYKIDLINGFYKDEHYFLKNFGGYSFDFPEESLKLKFPYYYYFAVNTDKGYWYLFNLVN